MLITEPQFSAGLLFSFDLFTLSLRTHIIICLAFIRWQFIFQADQENSSSVDRERQKRPVQWVQNPAAVFVSLVIKAGECELYWSSHSAGINYEACFMALSFVIASCRINVANFRWQMRKPIIELPIGCAGNFISDKELC